MIAPNEWRWFGSAGHFIASADCRFHLTTQVGRVLVSTIGDYYPSGLRPGVMRANAEGFAEVGWQRYFETFVFPLDDAACGCGCAMPVVSRWSEIDSQGYQTRGEANAGHLALCEKWAADEWQASAVPSQEAEESAESADV